MTGSRLAVRCGLRRRSRLVLAGGLVAGGVMVGAVAPADTAAVAGRPDPMPVTASGVSGGGPSGGGVPGGGVSGGGAATAVPCDPNRLIAAINHTNANGGGTLSLARRCTYTLTANQGGDGLPPIRQPIRILGADATIVRAANADAFRIFEVVAGGRLGLDSLTVTGGLDRTADGGAGLLVRAGGRAELSNTSVVRNLVTGSGGGITNSGIVTISSSDVDDNGAGASGAGIDNRGGATLTVTRSRLTGNDAITSGGAVENLGTVEITGSTLSRNTSGRGGAVRNDGGSAAIGDSGITDNTSSFGGGGIQNDGRLTVSNSTIGRNNANADGGGILNNPGATLVVENSDISENTTRGDGGGVLNSLGDVVLRGGRVRDNRAVGALSIAGGVDNESGSIALTGADVLGNSSTDAPGGVFTINGTANVDNRSLIDGNRPTNCTGHGDPVPNCFG